LQAVFIEIDAAGGGVVGRGHRVVDGAVGAQWNVSSSEVVKSTDELTENTGLSTLEPPGGV